MGLSKSLQVMAKDKVKLNVKAIYPQIDPGAANTDIGSYIVAGFLNSFRIESSPEQLRIHVIKTITNANV